MARRVYVLLAPTAVRRLVQCPFKGSKGFYGVNLKHAVSRVRHGEKPGLEILLHDVPEIDGHD